MQLSSNRSKTAPRFYSLTNLIVAIISLLLLSGCGSLFGAAGPEPTATPLQVRTAVPTFTPTPIQALPAPTAMPAVVAVAPAQANPVTLTTIVSPATTVAITPTVAIAAEPRLIVEGDAVNVRSGPDTTFDLVGAATQGQTFNLLAKNAQGDWWQVCCINDQPGWIYAELARVENAETVAVAADLPVAPPTPAVAVAEATATAPVVEAPAADVPAVEPATATPAPVAAPVADGSSAGNFDPNAAYQIVHFKVLGLDENNGGTRDSSAQHHIFITVLDAAGNGVDGAVVKNLVGDKLDIVTGNKGPGKAEVTMYWEPFKLYVATDPSGPTTSQISNQMGLAFPHLPDIVGRLGGLDYEYAVCPTIEVKCQWPIQAVHFSYEITFKKVK